MKKLIIVPTLLSIALGLIACSNTNEPLSKEDFEEYILKNHSEYYIDDYLRHAFVLKEAGITENDIEQLMKEKSLSYEDAWFQLIRPSFEKDLNIDFSREYFVIVGKYEGFYDEDLLNDLKKNSINSEHIQTIEVKELGEMITEGVTASYSIVEEIDDGVIVTGDQVTDDSDQKLKDLIIKAKIKEVINSDKWLQEMIEKYNVKTDHFLKR